MLRDAALRPLLSMRSMTTPMTAAPDSALATLWCPSPNREPRRDGRAVDMLVLHYTGMESPRRRSTG